MLVRVHNLAARVSANSDTEANRLARNSGGAFAGEDRGGATAQKTAGRIAIAGFAVGVVACSLSACSTAPAQDILGSFFPAWMLCAALGIAAAIVLRLALGAVGLAAFVPLPALTFIVLAIAMTLLIWLLRFGH